MEVHSTIRGLVLHDTNQDWHAPHWVLPSVKAIFTWNCGPREKSWCTLAVRCWTERAKATASDSEYFSTFFLPNQEGA